MRNPTKWVFLLLILSVFTLLTGMGGMNGAPEGTVPETDEEVSARVVDRGGVSVDLTTFSMDGNIFLTGMQGRGDVTIFFRDVGKVTFSEPSGDLVPTEVVMKDGKKLRLDVRKRAVFYGKTEYGAYQVKARDIASIVFP